MDKTPEIERLENLLAAKEEALSEVKAAYASLRREDNQRREMLKLFPVSFYEIDIATGKFSKINEIAGNHTGYTPEELIRMGPSDLLTEKSKALFETRRRIAMEGGQLSRAEEYEILTRDHQTKWLMISMKLVSEEGNPVRLQCMAFDITDRKKIEKNLRVSEDRFRRLAELLPETIFETNENGVINFVNKNAFLYFGYSFSDLQQGLNIFDVVAPVDRDRAIKNFNRIFNGEDIGIKEYLLIRKDGTTFPGMVLAAGLEKGDRIMGLRGFVVDLTDKKRLEAQLAQSQKMESIGTMAGGIAHDFNNILGAIIGYSELLEFFRTLEEDEIDAYLSKVLKAAYRAKELVKQILMFSRQTEPEKKPIRMVTIIQESLKLLRASLPSTIDIKENINEVKDTIYADATQIHQILMNLGANAGHAMRDAPGVLTVGVSQVDIDETASELLINLRPGPHIKITFQDTGHGMSLEIMDRVFEPYFTTKEKGEGTGLGLSVVHGIVSNHSGAITVSSQPGNGTQFNLYFPVITNIEVENKRHVPNIIPRGRERILFVDDEENLVKLGNEMLKYLGYDVTAVTSSLAALAAFTATPDGFDLVITDQTMPAMAGSELAKKILKIRPAMPIILCTGYSETLNESGAKEIGIQAFLMKPIVLHELAEIIRQVLDGTGGDDRRMMGP